MAWGATCTSTQTGNWNVAANWTGCVGGNGPAPNTPGSNDTAIIANGHTITANVALTVGAVIVNTGGTLSIGGGGGTNFTVNGTTTVNGTLAHATTSGNETYIGLVTIGSGGSWINTANESISFRGGLTHNGSSFTAGTGTYTFNTNAQSIGGASALTIPNVTVTGVTLTNTGTLTVLTALSGTGALTNAAGTTLNLGGTSGITTLNASASGNTVNYTGAAQTVKATSYYNLALSGSGTKTLTGVSAVNGDLTLSGTVTATTAANFTIGGDLTVGSGTTFTSANFTNLVSGSTSVSGTLAHSGGAAKTYVGAVTVNSGGSWTNAGNAPVTLRGGLTHDGSTFTAGTGTYTFNTNAQSIGGASALTIPNVTVTGVTLTNTGTLTVSTALSGTGGLTNGANATLNLGGTSAITTLTAGAAGNTVNYTQAGAQTVKATTYHHLGLSGSGTKTMTGLSTNNGNLTLSGTAAATSTATLSVGGNLSVGAGSGFTSGNTTFSVAGTTSVSGTLAHSVSGSKTYVGAVTINAGGAWTNTGGSPVTLRGGLTHNGGTFTAGTGTYTFDTNAQTIGGSSALTIANVTVTGVVLTNTGTLTVSTALSGTGGLANDVNATLSLGGTSAISALTAAAAGNTVNYTLAGAQTVRATTYHNLGISGSGVKTLAGDATVAGTLTLSGPTLAVGGNTLTLNGPAIAGTPANLTTTSASSLVFGGSASGVALPGSVTALNNLTLNNANGLSLASSPVVSGTLSLSSGVITTGSNSLTLASSCPASSSRANGHVNGNLVLTVPTGNPTCTFHVGDAIGYAPVTLAFSAVTGSGRVAVRADAGDHPDTTSGTSGVQESKSANHYWTVANGSPALAFSSYAITLQFCATSSCSASELDSGANPANFLVARKSSGSWSLAGAGNVTSNSVQLSGIAAADGFGEFAAGEANQCFTDGFTGANGASPGANWTVGSASGSFGSPVIQGNRLRLTSATTNVSSWATLLRPFPAAGNKVTIEFDHYAYGGTGGDGIAVVLSDAAVAPVVGAYGGSLGYAQKSNPGSDCTTAGGCPGFAGGWLGVGIDEYGNYSAAAEGRFGGTAGLVPDGVAIRGSGSGVSGYRYLRGTGTLTPSVDGSFSPAHRYRIIVDHTNGINAYTSVERNTGSGYVALIAPFDAKDPGYSQSQIPSRFIMSLVGSTGTTSNIHEIDNLSVCTVQALVAPTLHHIRIEHGGSACTGAGGTDVTIKACADANCTALYGGSVTVNLTPNASGSLTWTPTEPVTFTGGSITLTLASTNTGTITLAGGATSPTAANPTRCFNGTNETCSLTFSTCTFDAVEVGAAAATPIYTKLANTAFKLDVVRRSSSLSVTNIQLVDARSGTCSTFTPLTGATITPTAFSASPQTVNFNYPNAAANVRVRITNSSGGVSCSNDNFAIRPEAFALTSTASNGPGVVLRAGSDPFSITATAVYGSTTTSGYVGSPRLNAALLTTTLPNLGNLSATTFSPTPNPGEYTAPSMKYDEVGNFRLSANAVYDDSFAAVDSVKGDCNPGFSNSLSNGRYSCQFGSVAAGPFGRFVPHQFAVVATAANACTAGGYTYMGQVFNLSALALVEARNAAGAVTKNYADDYAVKGAVVFGAENNDNGIDLGSALAFVGTGSWQQGVYTLGANGVIYTRPSLPAGPLDQLTIGLTVNDSEVNTNPRVSGADMNPAVAGGIANTHKALNPSPMRMRMLYGRLRLLNAYGSERLALPLVWETQYWDGQMFIRNSQDNCTSLSAANIALSNYQSPPKPGGTTLSSSNLSSVTVGAINAGRGTITLAPTQPAIGSVDLVANLGRRDLPGPPVPPNCPDLSYGASTSAGLAYLSGQWCGAANDRDPTARASFGVYKSPLIYRRENY